MSGRLEVSVNMDKLLTQWRFEVKDPQQLQINNEALRGWLIIEKKKETTVTKFLKFLKIKKPLTDDVQKELETKIADFLFDKIIWPYLNMFLTCYRAPFPLSGIGTDDPYYSLEGKCYPTFSYKDMKESWEKLIKSATTDEVILPAKDHTIVTTRPHIVVYSFGERQYFAVKNPYTISIAVSSEFSVSNRFRLLYKDFVKKVKKRVHKMNEILVIKAEYPPET